MMRTQHTGGPPSDRLSSGHVAGFEEALALVEQELACEDRAYRIMDEGQAPIKAALRHASRAYREEQEAARLRTIDRLRADALAAEAALDDEAARWLGLLAESLESGDYA